MESPLPLCRFCGHGNPAGARFCNACGEPLHLMPCPYCEAINDRAAVRCHKCHRALPDPAPASAAAAPASEARLAPLADLPRLDERVFIRRSRMDADPAISPLGREEPHFAPEHARNITPDDSAAVHASARSPWRDPKPRRAPVIFGLVGVAVLAAVYALQHYDFPVLRPTAAANAIAPTAPAEPAPPSSSATVTPDTTTSATPGNAQGPAAAPPPATPGIATEPGGIPPTNDTPSSTPGTAAGDEAAAPAPVGDCTQEATSSGPCR